VARNQTGPELAQPQIYADIVGKILSGEFPPGQRLVEEELAKAYRISRTPIREVLMALQRDGLAERVPNRGARVISFTPDDVEEIYEIRQALECLSIRAAARNLKLSDLREFEQRLLVINREQDPAWKEKQAELDLQLHHWINSHSENRRLTAYLENISLLIHSLRLLGYANEVSARQAGQEHLAIVRALLRRDAELATRLLADHIENSKRHALDAYFARGAQPVTRRNQTPTLRLPSAKGVQLLRTAR
jgi:DNA-binding GntR family transcriptional regulator